MGVGNRIEISVRGGSARGRVGVSFLSEHGGDSWGRG